MQALTPALNYPAELLLQAQGIRVAFFDVDGVLTDGGLYFSEVGEALKRFNTLDGQGLKLLQQLRQSGLEIPVLILTARDSVTDRVDGLQAGADDYLLKPFDLRELFARLQTLLRRVAGRSVNLIEHGALTYDPSSRETRLAGQSVDLSRREFALLRVLLEQRGRPIGRESLQQRLYGWDEDVASNALDVHIHALRKKLDPALIRTLRGIGYALDEKVAQATAEDRGE